MQAIHFQALLFPQVHPTLFELEEHCVEEDLDSELRNVEGDKLVGVRVEIRHIAAVGDPS